MNFFPLHSSKKDLGSLVFEERLVTDISNFPLLFLSAALIYKKGKRLQVQDSL